jgi:hypothetical protein
MAYIYERAEEVVVWLGGLEGALANPNSLEVESEETAALCSVPYWRRVWIVQEIGGELSAYLFQRNSHG